MQALILLIAFPSLVLASEAAADPSFLSVLPPLVAVALALTTRQVLPSLFSAVLLGACLVGGASLVQGFILTTSHYCVEALADKDHAAIILFSMALSGMVGVMSRSGGSQGIVQKMAPLARTPVRAQLATWVMGLVIFFDDYANTLLVGNTMRPLTDRLRISRAKLAFLVDSTAAPVAGLAAISTWVGFEVGLIEAAFQEMGRDQSAYLIFLETIPLRFYSIFCLVLVLFVAGSGRDFGPMLEAEKEARRRPREEAESDEDPQLEEALRPDPEQPKHWWYAVFPVLFLFFATGIGLWINGSTNLRASLKAKAVANLEAQRLEAHRAAWRPESVGQTEPPPAPKISGEEAQRIEAQAQSQAEEAYAKAGVNDVLGEASSSKVLLFVSFAGSFLAIALPYFGGVLTLEVALEAWTAGAKGLVPAMMILVLAWSLGAVCSDLQTGAYIAGSLKSVLHAPWLPSLTFIASAAISFATGSSWGTMSILMPISLPLAVQMASQAAAAAGDPGSAAYLAAEAPILHGTIGAILAGSCFGDHCSPISDTTILSSMASGCDHVEHVRTQMPYALVAGGLAVLVGHLPAAYGMPAKVCLIAGILAMAGILLLLGKSADAEVALEKPESPPEEAED